MDALQIAPGRLGAEGHGAVNPGAYLHGPAAAQVAPEAGRNLDDHLELAAGQAALDLAVICQRGLLGEVDRPGAPPDRRGFRRVVPVERGEGQMVHIRVDPGTQRQHQEGRPQKRETEADGIAPQLQAFADRIGEQAAEAEAPAWRRPAGIAGLGGGLGGCGADGVLDIANEGFLQVSGCAGGDQPACRSPAHGRIPSAKPGRSERLRS